MMTSQQVEKRVQLWLDRAAALDREGMIAASRAVAQCARDLESDDTGLVLEQDEMSGNV